MKLVIRHTEIILFVKDQTKAADFYQKLFSSSPSLHVPGMTEFIISEHCTLGLMPKTGIGRLLQLESSNNEPDELFPKCELYLFVEDAKAAVKHGVSCGAKLVSPVQPRDWGDSVGYVKDPDGHLIAFATKTNQ